MRWDKFPRKNFEEEEALETQLWKRRTDLKILTSEESALETFAKELWHSKGLDDYEAHCAASNSVKQLGDVSIRSFEQNKELVNLIIEDEARRLVCESDFIVYWHSWDYQKQIW